MGAIATSEIFLFERFRLDRRRGGGLFCADENGGYVPVTIGSRAFDVLSVLVQRHGDLVLKEDIMTAVWRGTVVADSNLPTQIFALRRILDQGRARGSCIQTIAGRGYRFVAPLSRVQADGRSASAAMPPRLSIVVLPFVNLGNDPEQQYFADGITDDVTTDLSRLAGMLVISRNTAFTYKNKPFDTKQIGRELSVRYVLEGSVRRLGKQIRINAQLIDAEADTHLWAARFNGDTSDLFALQDEITSRIAVALNSELISVEAARRPEHPDALDYIFRGRAARLEPQTREIQAERTRLFERALALDPGSIEAQSWLAAFLASRVLANMTDTPQNDLLRAEDLVARALAASPDNLLPHHAKAFLLRAQGRYAEAIPEYEAVLALCRNWVTAYFGLGQCKLFTGLIDETIPLIERAIRLSPRDPELGVWYQNIGQVHLLQSRTAEAIIWLEKARNYAPARSLIRAWLASAYGLNGETGGAAAELAEARRLSGDDRFSSLARLRALGSYRTVVPTMQALFEATYFIGLRKAGIPEE